MTKKVNEEKAEALKRLDDLISSCPRCQSKESKELITKAFNLAYLAHNNVKRKSGELYIFHPLAVAKIVGTEMGLGTKSIVCAILHDVVEDSDYNIDYINERFGEKIGSIIEGLTKITGAFDKSSQPQVETFRKILLTISEDIRVILIKIADRLHNMRTLGALPETKQQKIAGETLFLYSPLAHRLGLYAIKTELENLCLKHQHTEVYEELENKISHSEKISAHFLKKFIEPIKRRLKSEGFDFDINGRPKSIYSVWKKMQTKNIPFEEVFDILAVRIVFKAQKGIPEKKQCWNIYSIITDIYKPKPDRIRDWVSNPKANGYEALHLTLMGPHGKWIEAQIRSERMDEIAEKGFAAHWKYKEPGQEDSELDKWIKKIQEMMINPEMDAIDFMDEFKMNLFTKEITIFTPKGHLKTLPKNATVLDFAFDIHSDIGTKAIGAKVNHKLVALSTKLTSGDQVEILTSDIQTPQREWLNYVITAKARARIRKTFRVERKKLIEKGMIVLENKLKEIKLYPNSQIFRKLFNAYEVINKEDLYYKIAQDIPSIERLKNILKKRSRSKIIRYWQLQISKTGLIKPKKWEDEEILENKESNIIISGNQDEPEFAMAKCCMPIPGDKVVGFQFEDSSVIIHKPDCPNAIKLDSQHGDKIISVQWKTSKILSFLAKIQISGIDKLGIINNITNVISKELNVNMRLIHIETHDGIFDGIIDLYVYNTDDLNNLILNLMRIKGIESVNRIENIDETQN
ncbi:RelA/SpoT family protein [Bacteroidota bacterium]